MTIPALWIKFAEGTVDESTTFKVSDLDGLKSVTSPVPQEIALRYIQIKEAYIESVLSSCECFVTKDEASGKFTVAVVIDKITKMMISTSKVALPCPPFCNPKTPVPVKSI